VILTSMTRHCWCVALALALALDFGARWVCAAVDPFFAKAFLEAPPGRAVVSSSASLVGRRGIGMRVDDRWEEEGIDKG